MNNCQIIFLAGVHGTGKGHFCERLLRISPWQHLSASALLKWSEYAEAPEKKEVMSIPDTQERLLAGLEKACILGGRYLLDGHLTLLNREGVVTRIDSQVFERIKPKAIILKTESARTVQERLCARDGRVYSLALIKRMLSEESVYSAEIASHLNIPHFVITPENEGEMLVVVAHLAEQLSR